MTRVSLAVLVIALCVQAAAQGDVRNEPVVQTKHQAVAIRAEPATPDGRIILPGQRVDVLLMRSMPVNKTASSTIVCDALVYAVYVSCGLGQTEPTAVPITRHVSNEHSAVLSAAMKAGKLALVIRPDDKNQGENGEKESVLPPKHKAMAVAVAPADLADGIVPGSRVDVLVRATSADKKTQTKTVLTNILVAAVDQTFDQPGLATPLTITLAVAPEAAKNLLAATKDGKILLKLHQSEHKDAPKKPAGPAK